MKLEAFKLPSIMMQQEDLTSGQDVQGTKRQLCNMSDFKFGFRDVLEPAKKQKKLEE